MSFSELAVKSADENTPWYKQFWPWFVIALPASVVIAGIMTWMIAVDNRDSLVMDDYYKQGLGINRQLAEEEKARQLQLQADFQVDTVVGEVFLNLAGNMGYWPETLQLKLIHPTISEKDINLTLEKISTSRYRAQLERPIDGRWYVQVNGERPAPWRLRAEIDLNKQPRWTLP